MRTLISIDNKAKHNRGTIKEGEKNIKSESKLIISNAIRMENKMFLCEELISGGKKIRFLPISNLLGD